MSYKTLHAHNWCRFASRIEILCIIVKRKKRCQWPATHIQISKAVMFFFCNHSWFHLILKGTVQFLALIKQFFNILNYLCLFTVLRKMMRLEIFNERLARHWVRVDKVEYVIGNSIPQVFPLNQLYLAGLIFLLIGREKI